jgi:hypothetical protein
MASKALTGGLSSLVYLGCVDSNGAVERKSQRGWVMEDNGNPSNIVDIAGELVGDVLFTVERDFNKNVCCYVMGDNGLVPQWLIIPDHVDVENAEVEDLRDVVHTEELTYIETRGYGVEAKGPGQFGVRAIKGETFTMATHAGKTRACVTLNGYRWFVHRIFLHTKPNLVGFPSVFELHLTLHDEAGKVTQFFYSV